MHELQTMFRQLGDLVMMQQDDLDRLDVNIEETSGRVTVAQREILRYLASISGNRWLMVRLFLILAFFATIFFVFFV